jgi:hypothetical protein
VSLDTSSLDQMGPVLTVSTFTPINTEIKVENDRSSNVLPGAAEVSSTAAF